jgi:hypothetical protein
MAAVVVDSSLLIALAADEQFDLLRSFYSVIYVPPAVWCEVTSVPALFGARESQEARDAGWLLQESPETGLLKMMVTR